MHSLTSWYDRPETDVVAYSAEKVLSFGNLIDEFSKWVLHLESRYERYWGVHTVESFECLAIVLALWHLDKVPCLLGDLAPGYCADISNTVEAFTHDISVQDETIERVPPRVLGADQYLMVFTSGSTGRPKPIPKYIFQLEKEAQILSEQWTLSDDTVVLGTVSHQHLYGLTFRLIWPFLSGQVFHSQACKYTEDIPRQSELCGKCILISSPSHLGRLNEHEDWQKVGERCELIVSSAAALDADISHRVAQIFDQPVFEVYGSSEAGIIAWRSMQVESRQKWSAFTGISVSSEEGCLRLESPLINGSFTTSDYVKFEDETKQCHQFDLLGRADRIVKLEGKRVCLEAIELKALSHVAIEKACAFVVQCKHRAEIAVVCQISQDFLIEHIEIEYTALKQGLSAMMRQYFPNVVSPRRWRILDQLPQNTQGKLALATMQRLFNEEKNRMPQILRRRRIDEFHQEFELRILESIDYFAGHFDPAPILPGVAQVDWAAQLGRASFMIEGPFKSLEVIKFQHIVSPSQVLWLRLEYKPITHKVIFSYVDEKRCFSSGRVCFEKAVL